VNQRSQSTTQAGIATDLLARGFSSHRLVFYLFPALYFLVPLAPKRPSGSLG
jgi:hypothetical protein